MAGKRVLLTLNPKIYGILKQKAEDSYMSIQELISEVLRKDVLSSQKKQSKKPKVNKSKNES